MKKETKKQEEQKQEKKQSEFTKIQTKGLQHNVYLFNTYRQAYLPDYAR